MKKEVALRWAAALESKHYKQGTLALRSPDNCFCVLGVLCNLHAQAHPAFAAMQHDPLVYDRSSTSLPPSPRDWAGISRPFPRLPNKSALTRRFSPNETVSISYLNDEGVNFRLLAKLIRKYWADIH